MDDKKWEQKDIRISKMNALSNSTNFVTACIQSGVFKPKDLVEGFETIKGFMDQIFLLTYGCDAASPSGREEKEMDNEEPPQEVGGSSNPPNYVCESCNAGITEGVSNYSLEWYGRGLCMDCQKKHKKKKTG